MLSFHVKGGYLDFSHFTELKAWSDRKTDLLRRENGQNMQNLVIR